MESQREGDPTSDTSKYRYRRWLGVFGGILVFSPQYLPSFWGNTTVYFTSYLYREHGSTWVSSPWPVASFLIGTNLGVILVHFFTCLGQKTFLFSAIIVCNAGIICTYFALKHDAAILFFTAYGVTGVCGGITQPLVFKALSDISGSSKGCYKSIASSGFNFGPFVINFLIGFYMNPDNIIPSLIVNDVPIFNQNDLIDRVPTLLLTQGTASFLCMFVGCCLLFYSLNYSTQNEVVQTYGSFETDNDCAKITRSREDSQETTVGMEATGDTSQCADHPENMTTCSNVPASTTRIEERNNDCEQHGEFLTMLQILQYPPFYVMCFAYSINVFPMILLNTSYKTYGLMFIKDDQFLISLGSIYSIVGGLARVAWGFFLDRFSIKSCLTFSYTFLSLAILLMYFAPMIDKYIYLFAVLAIALGVNQVLPTFLVIVEAYFGENNFYKVFGLLSTSRVPLSFIISPVFEQLFVRFGWFSLFCCSACLTTVSLVLIILIIPVTSPIHKSK